MEIRGNKRKDRMILLMKHGELTNYGMTMYELVSFLLFASFGIHCPMFVFKQTESNANVLLVFVVVVWKCMHSGSVTKTRAEDLLPIYYPRLLYFPDQMLAVVVLSQHRVLSSKIVRPRSPCDALCMEHAIRTIKICSANNRNK